VWGWLRCDPLSLRGDVVPAVPGRVLALQRLGSTQIQKGNAQAASVHSSPIFENELPHYPFNLFLSSLTLTKKLRIKWKSYIIYIIY